MSASDALPSLRRVSVVLGVVTCRRPTQLGQLLPELVAQVQSLDESATVLIVDNDADLSARPVIEALDSEWITYVTESTPGIAAARNRAIDVAGTADLLAFIDDDEVPEPGWLAALVKTQRETDSTLVTGPVRFEFESEPTNWIKNGGFFFERPHRPTGTLVDDACSNNLLMDLEQIRKQNIRFDVDFGLTGGSDDLFTRAVVKSAGSITWCDEARAVEIVPTSRLNREWCLKRAMRVGMTNARALVRLSGPHFVVTLGVRARLALTGLARMLYGALRVLTGMVVRSDRLSATGSKGVARGLGFFLGALGIYYREYQHLHRQYRDLDDVHGSQ